jgi:hypothetical protein
MSNWTPTDQPNDHPPFSTAPLYQWVTGPNKNHCDICTRIEGSVHTMPQWYAILFNLFPPVAKPHDGCQCHLQLVPIFYNPDMDFWQNDLNMEFIRRQFGVLYPESLLPFWMIFKTYDLLSSFIVPVDSMDKPETQLANDAYYWAFLPKLYSQGFNYIVNQPPRKPTYKLPPRKPTIYPKAPMS